ncbi:MAG: zinc metalloprotease HtpX [Candidatus Sumerlaeaceae bacterium]|nr:zinc metalloprotease HtpX [Candidatus Sumerlaeaceae bacterium]
MNTLKTGILLSSLTLLFVAIGSLLGGSHGAIIAFAIAVVMNVGSYWFSDKIVLKMVHAQPVSREEAPEMTEMIERLARRAGIPTPRLYLVPDPSPNAFATGRNPANGVVAINQGLLDLLNREEVEGVVAHELGHIKHRDTLTMAVVATIAGAIMMLVNIAQFGMMFGGHGGNDREGGGGGNILLLLVTIIVAPLAATLIQMGISRAREFEADRAGAEIAGSPQGLMNALVKLHNAPPMETLATPSTAHMYISNPLSGVGGVSKWFMTHPPVEERLAALRRL